MNDLHYLLMDNEHQRVFGELIIEHNRNSKKIAFILNDQINPEAWNSLGFIPVDIQSRSNTNQDMLVDFFYGRLPLKERQSKKKSLLALSEVLQKFSNINVHTDTLTLARAS